jgi:hypothetical protein
LGGLSQLPEASGNPNKERFDLQCWAISKKLQPFL